MMSNHCQIVDVNRDSWPLIFTTPLNFRILDVVESGHMTSTTFMYIIYYQYNIQLSFVSPIWVRCQFSTGFLSLLPQLFESTDEISVLRSVPQTASGEWIDFCSHSNRSKLVGIPLTLRKFWWKPGSTNHPNPRRNSQLNNPTLTHVHHLLPYNT